MNVLGRIKSIMVAVHNPELEQVSLKHEQSHTSSIVMKKRRHVLLPTPQETEYDVLRRTIPVDGLQELSDMMLVSSQDPDCQQTTLTTTTTTKRKSTRLTQDRIVKMINFDTQFTRHSGRKTRMYYHFHFYSYSSV